MRHLEVRDLRDTAAGKRRYRVRSSGAMIRTATAKEGKCPCHEPLIGNISDLGLLYLWAVNAYGVVIRKRQAKSLAELGPMFQAIR